jgi:hypothetical protein
MWRTFVRDLSDEARYYRFMTRLSDLPETMAERVTNIEYIGHLALVAEVFTDASATRIGEARYIVERCCRVRHWAAPDLPHAAARSCRAFQHLSHARRHHCSEQGDHLARQAQGVGCSNPEAGRLVHLRKDLPTDNQIINVPGRAFGGCVGTA